MPGLKFCTKLTNILLKYRHIINTSQKTITDKLKYGNANEECMNDDDYLLPDTNGANLKYNIYFFVVV